MSKNKKTPKLANLPFSEGIVPEKIELDIELENALENELNNQINLSTMFQTHHTGRPVKTLRFEKPNTKPSQTIPDQSLTVSQIMTRYAQGRPLGGQLQTSYDQKENEEIDFDDYLPDLSKMDLADKHELLEKAKEHLDEVKKKLNGLKAARDKQAKEKADKLAADLKAFKEYQDKQNDLSQGRDKGEA